jgi:hypothetical protein
VAAYLAARTPRSTPRSPLDTTTQALSTRPWSPGSHPQYRRSCVADLPFAPLIVGTRAGTRPSRTGPRLAWHSECPVLRRSARFYPLAEVNFNSPAADEGRGEPGVFDVARLRGLLLTDHRSRLRTCSSRPRGGLLRDPRRGAGDGARYLTTRPTARSRPRRGAGAGRAHYEHRLQACFVLAGDLWLSPCPILVLQMQRYGGSHPVLPLFLWLHRIPARHPVWWCRGAVLLHYPPCPRPWPYFPWTQSRRAS